MAEYIQSNDDASNLAIYAGGLGVAALGGAALAYRATSPLYKGGKSQRGSKTKKQDFIDMYEAPGQSKPGRLARLFGRGGNNIPASFDQDVIDYARSRMKDPNRTLDEAIKDTSTVYQMDAGDDLKKAVQGDIDKYPTDLSDRNLAKLRHLDKRHDSAQSILNDPDTTPEARKQALAEIDAYESKRSKLLKNSGSKKKAAAEVAATATSPIAGHASTKVGVSSPKAAATASGNTLDQLSDIVSTMSRRSAAANLGGSSFIPQGTGKGGIPDTWSDASALSPKWDKNRAAHADVFGDIYEHAANKMQTAFPQHNGRVGKAIEESIISSPSTLKDGLANALQTHVDRGMKPRDLHTSARGVRKQRGALSTTTGVNPALTDRLSAYNKAAGMPGVYDKMVSSMQNNIPAGYDPTDKSAATRSIERKVGRQAMADAGLRPLPKSRFGKMSKAFRMLR